MAGPRSGSSLPRWLIISGALVPIIGTLVGGCYGAVRTLSGTVDRFEQGIKDTYVTKRDFDLIHQRDSLTWGMQLREIQSTTRQLYAACQRRGDCPRE